MKREVIERNIFRSGDITETAMGLAAGSEAFIFGVLRKDLYSDPIGSLLREYLVNARDEHRKLKKGDVPIEVTLPNYLSPELRIRDFGRGLTEEETRYFFGNFGASDKRESNDVVGFFGLGCKSAHAYTDAFVVESYLNGEKLTFNIYVDETEVGRVALIGRDATDEPNGVCVVVPVQSFHISDFVKKAFETVKWFDTKPIFHGVAEVPNFDKGKPIVEGDDWLYFGSGDPLVVMGEIGYPINVYAMGQLESWERSLLVSDIVIKANIGEVQVTASREALQMSEKTINAIRAKLAKIKAEMIDKTTEAIRDAKNIIEAKSMYYEAVMNGGGYGQVLRQSGAAIEWNGQKIDNNFIRLPGGKHSVRVYTKRSWKKTIELVTDERISCHGKLKLYFDDTNKTQVGYKRRAKTLMNEGAEQVAILLTEDVADLEKILGFKVSELPSFEAVVPTVEASARRASSGVDKSKRVKHAAKHFALNLVELDTFWRGTASNCWTLEETNLEEGLYIPIDRFHPTLDGLNKLPELKKLIRALKAYGVAFDLPIYGIKPGADTGELIRFDEWAKEQINAIAGLKDDYALVREFRNSRLQDVSRIDDAQLSDGVAKSYISLYKRARDLYNDSNKRENMDLLIHFVGGELPFSEALSDALEAFVETFPIITLVPDWRRDDEIVLNYIKEKE